MNPKSFALMGAGLLLVAMVVVGSAVRYYYSTTVVVQLGTLKNELEAKLVENAHLAAANEQLQAQVGNSQNRANQLSRDNRALQTELVAAQSQLEQMARARESVQMKENQGAQDPEALEPLPANGPAAKARWESARFKPLDLADLERRMRTPPSVQLRLKHLFDPTLCEWSQESWEFEIFPRFGCPRDSCPAPLEPVLEAVAKHWHPASLSLNNDKSWLDGPNVSGEFPCPWRDFQLFIWMFDDGSAGAFVMPDTAGAINCTTHDAFGVPAEVNEVQTALHSLWERIRRSPTSEGKPPGLSYSKLGITVTLDAKDAWPDKVANPTLLPGATKYSLINEFTRTREVRTDYLKFKATPVRIP